MKAKGLILSLVLLAVGLSLGIVIGRNKMAQTSKLNQTDIVQVWQDFVKNEVLAQNKLSNEERYLVLIVANVAAQGQESFRQVFEEALDAQISPIKLHEAVVQTIPYVGMAKTADFLMLANQIMTQKGINLPLASQATVTPETRFDKGLKAQCQIFGEQNILAMRDSAPANLKHIQDFLSTNCFGDYYTRTGLELKTRELLTFATLVALGGADAQVKAHAQGNINIGNDKEVLFAALTQMLPYIGYPRTLNGIAAVSALANN